MLKLIRVACIILTLLICVTVILSGAEKKKVEKFILPEYEKFLLDETDVPVYKLDYQGKSIGRKQKKVKSQNGELFNAGLIPLVKSFIMISGYLIQFKKQWMELISILVICLQFSMKGRLKIHL